MDKNTKMNSKIFCIFLKYDYGIKSRGESLEIRAFYPALKSIFQEIEVFWLEDHGFPENSVSIQGEIIDQVKTFRPDYVFTILMNDEISEKTLIELNTLSKVINWFCDDQWRFEIYSKYVAKNLYLSITTDKFSLSKYKSLGLKAVLSQWAAYESISENECKNQNYKYDVTFIGSKNPTREWVVDSLKDHGINVVCFGSGWGTKRVSYEEMKTIVLSSKINLNLSNSVPSDINFLIYLIKGIVKSFFRPKNLINYLKALKFLFFNRKRIEQIKARNFEIPGLGGFQLSQYAINLNQYFVDGQDIVMFSNLNELVVLIKYYLDNIEEREVIRFNGWVKTQSYTYENNLRKVFGFLNENGTMDNFDNSPS